ncbi:MAG: FG-GAP repeat protein, partial [Candidatus Brocadiae bacterium]|nr:FG-GAP repeat protein [Candidatus Brocadiia bacterium]
RILGDDAGDISGASVSSAGDVNGDGYDDFLIGAYWADPAGGGEAGETYLVFGRTGDGADPTVTGIALTDDTGASGTDRLTNDTTPVLTFVFSESIYGVDSDVTLVDPDSMSIAPDSVTGWGTDTLVVTFSTPLAMDGQYTVTLDGTATIVDGAGNPLNGGVDEVVYFTLDTVAPQIVSWHSAADHGPVGEAVLLIPDDGTFGEPRADGIHRLLVTFDEAIDPASLAPSSVAMAGNDVNGDPVPLDHIVVSTSTREGDTVGVIGFSPVLPDYARYVVQVQGVTDAAGNVLTGDNDRIMTALVGDVNGDLRVNNTDIGWVRLYRDALQGSWIDPSDPYQARTDITLDGLINNTDLGWVRLYRDAGRDARFIDAPILPGGSGSLVGSPGHSGLRGVRGLGGIRRRQSTTGTAGVDEGIRLVNGMRGRVGDEGTATEETPEKVLTAMPLSAKLYF